MTSFQKSTLIYLAGLFVISYLFFYPALSGKILKSHDTVANAAASKEGFDYMKKGDPVYWTTHIFSGMPTYNLAAKTSNNFLGSIVNKFEIIMPSLIQPLLLAMICLFLSMMLLGIHPMISFISAVAYGLNTWTMDSLGAGHVTKIMAIGYISLVFSGFIYTMRSDKWWGYIFIGLGLSLSIAVNHPQETYYGAIMCALAGLYFLYEYFKEGKLFPYFKKIIFVILMVLLAVMSNISALYNLNDYSKETMRGGKTELKKIESGNKSTGESGGLDINYAFSWSYGMSELFNFIVPDALGGSSNYNIKTTKSELAQRYNSAEDYIQLPFYWGDQPFTGGPNYIGAILMFLFLCYFFYSQDKIKWLFLSISILSIIMGLGKNFMAVNEFLFNYLPAYNKFRTPTMSFSIVNMIAVIAAGMFLNDLYQKEIDKTYLFQKLKMACIAMGGLFIIGLLAVSSGGYSGPSDAGILQQQPNFPMELLKTDRESLFKSDLIRSLILILIAAGLIYGLIKDYFKKNIVIMLLGLLIIGDLWFVSKRYISNDIFEEASNPEDLVPNESYNQLLSQDKSYFRVFNTTVSTFNDNIDGFRFSNVGGYSPAKLYRYQDLIDRQLSKGSMPALSMLNMKYFIVDNQGQKSPQQNPNACGNAWFIHTVKWVENADAEMDSLTSFDPKNTVIIDQRYKNNTNYETASDPLSKIELTKYHPDNLDYTSTSSTGGFAVFSEIWYRGNEEWKIYIDGKETKMVRVNYLLRGAYIPAGTHKIEMKFRPTKLLQLLNVSFISTIFLVLACLIVGFLSFKKSNKNKEQSI